MALFLKLFLTVLVGVGYYYVNKAPQYEDTGLKLWHNVILAALALGWISLIIAG